MAGDHRMTLLQKILAEKNLILAPNRKFSVKANVKDDLINGIQKLHKDQNFKNEAFHYAQEHNLLDEGTTLENWTTFTSQLQRAIKDWKTELKIENGNLILHRAITSKQPDAYIKNLKDGKYDNDGKNFRGLGIFWSWKHRPNMPTPGGNSGTKIILKGAVPFDAIDLKGTALRLMDVSDYHDEKEIRLKAGSQITLLDALDKSGKSLLVKPISVLASSRFKLKAEEILTAQKSADAAYRNIKEGRKSKTKGPLEVWKLEDGRYLLTDGQHRFIQGLLQGKTEFEVEQIGEGYSDYWATPMHGAEFDLQQFLQRHKSKKKTALSFLLTAAANGNSLAEDQDKMSELKEYVKEYTGSIGNSPKEILDLVEDNPGIITDELKGDPEKILYRGLGLNAAAMEKFYTSGKLSRKSAGKEANSWTTNKKVAETFALYSNMPGAFGLVFKRKFPLNERIVDVDALLGKEGREDEILCHHVELTPAELDSIHIVLNQDCKDDITKKDTLEIKWKDVPDYFEKSKQLRKEQKCF